MSSDGPLLLRTPSSPHPSEKHDHRSDPVYASFQRKLCAAIIVTVVVLTVIVLATHHWGSSDDTPATPTPAFPLMPVGGWTNSYYAVTLNGATADATNQTGFEWKRGAVRYAAFLDAGALDLSWRILLNYTAGMAVWQQARGRAGAEPTATCTVLNGPKSPVGEPPQWQLLNTTYVTDSAVVNGVACDQWTGREFVPYPPLGPTGDWRSVTYYQRRDTGYPMRLTRAATAQHAAEDFFYHDFTTAAPAASWFLPFACPQGLQPNPDPPARARSEL